MSPARRSCAIGSATVVVAVAVWACPVVAALPLPRPRPEGMGSAPVVSPTEPAAVEASDLGLSIPDDRFAAAFGLFGDVRPEQRDEAASGEGTAPVETVALPPRSMVDQRPELVAPSFEPASAYAAVEAEEVAPPIPPLRAEATPLPTPRDAAAALAQMVPLPRHRPAHVPAVEPAKPEAHPAPGAIRVAGLGPAAVPGLEPEPPAVAVVERPMVGEPRRIPKEALPYLALIRREAAANKVPLWLAIGVGWVESKYQPNLRGSHGVVGLMQVMPSTARFQGYRGPTEGLIDPETNIVWGLRELGWAHQQARGDACLTIAKYKGGVATRSISASAADYCRRAKQVTGVM